MNHKTSVAETNHHHWSKILVKRGYLLVQSAKCYSLLLKAFEENGGNIDINKLDELEAAAEGDLTRRQITKWFWYRRKKLGLSSKNLPRRTEFPKRTQSVLLHVFAKNSGYVCGEELDGLEETLELTRTQIKCWFYHERCRRRKLSEGPRKNGSELLSETTLN